MKRGLMFFIVAAGLITSLTGAGLLAADDEAASAQRAKDEQFVALLMRLENIDLNTNDAIKKKVMGVLDRNQGTQLYLDLVKRFELKENVPALVTLALDKPDDTLGVEAARLVFQFNKGDAFAKLLTQLPNDGKGRAIKKSAMQVLSRTNLKAGFTSLIGVVTDEKQPKPLRTDAINAMGLTRGGERRLLQLVKDKKLSEDMHFVAGNVLFASLDESIRGDAKKHIKLPASLSAKPLPPISELVKRKGDAVNGLKVMKKTQCFICHRVQHDALGGINEGKDVGPALSEIGSKLALDAMYVSILDPSAGIEHNYTAHHVETEDGEELVGIIISETKDKVVVRVAGGVTYTLKPGDIYSRRALKSSLMPPNLQLAMTEQELVDLVAFLSVLKKK